MKITTLVLLLLISTSATAESYIPSEFKGLDRLYYCSSAIDFMLELSSEDNKLSEDAKVMQAIADYLKYTFAMSSDSTLADYADIRAATYEHMLERVMLLVKSEDLRGAYNLGEGLTRSCFELLSVEDQEILATEIRGMIYK